MHEMMKRLRIFGPYASPTKYNVTVIFKFEGGGLTLRSVTRLTSCVSSSGDESHWRSLSWTRMKSPRRNWNFRLKKRNCYWTTSDASVFWACNKIFMLVKTRDVSM